MWDGGPGKRRRLGLEAGAPVVPVYKTEADALVGERLPLATLHFMRGWSEVLGLVACSLFLHLRAEALASTANWAETVACTVSQRELARRLRVDLKTLRKAIGVLREHKLIEVEPRTEYSDRLGRVVNATHRYRVVMYDPPVPGPLGEGEVLSRQAHRLVTVGRLLAGDEPAAACAARHPPRSVGTSSPRSARDSFRLG